MTVESQNIEETYHESVSSSDEHSTGTEGQQPNRRYKFLILHGNNKAEMLFYVRAKVFFEEQGYSMSDLEVEYKKEAIHILALKNQTPVGVVTIFREGQNGLPVEKYVNLTSFKAENRKNMYFSKLAVVREERKKFVGHNLIFLANEIARVNGIRKVFLGAKSDNRESIYLFQKTGCKEIVRFVHPGIGKIILFMIDVENESIFQRQPQLVERKARIFRSYFPELMQSLHFNEIT